MKELSERNKYYVNRFRYNELRFFCRQYDIWKAAYKGLSTLVSQKLDGTIPAKDIVKPVEITAAAADDFLRKINMVEYSAELADPTLAKWIVKGVTEGLSYDIMNARETIPCCRDDYYRAYRKFFWILSRKRD